MKMYFVKGKESNLFQSKTGYFKMGREKIKTNKKKVVKIEKEKENFTLCLQFG